VGETLTPTEPAASGTGVEEQLDKSNPNKIRETGKEGKIIEEKLTVRKEDIVPRKLIQEALVMVTAPVLRGSKDLVDFRGGEVDHRILRDHEVLDPGERVFFLLLDRHEKIGGADLTGRGFSMSGKERVIPGGGVVKREQKASHPGGSLKVVSFEGAGREILLNPLVDPFKHGGGHDVESLEVGEDGESETVEEKNSFDERGVVFAGDKFRHSRAELTEGRMKDAVRIHLEPKKNTQVHRVVLGLDLRPGRGQEESLDGGAVLKRGENNCFLGVD
jgi:hypothetical protein